MKTFRNWDVDQDWLLPPSLGELVPADHVAHFIRDLVRNELDLTSILSSYDDVKTLAQLYLDQSATPKPRSHGSTMEDCNSEHPHSQLGYRSFWSLKVIAPPSPDANILFP
jgi:hypothetical protein